MSAAISDPGSHCTPATHSAACAVGQTDSGSRKAHFATSKLSQVQSADLADLAQEFPAHKLLQRCKACSNTHTEFLPRLPHHHSGKADICRDHFQPYILQWLVLGNAFWLTSRALPLPAHIMELATHGRETFTLNSYKQDVSTFYHAK